MSARVPKLRYLSASSSSHIKKEAMQWRGGRGNDPISLDNREAFMNLCHFRQRHGKGRTAVGNQEIEKRLHMSGVKGSDQMTSRVLPKHASS